MKKGKPPIHYKPCVEGIVLARREESSKSSSAFVEPVIPIIILYEMSCYIDECISNSCVGMFVAIGCDIQNQKLEKFMKMIILLPTTKGWKSVTSVDTGDIQTEIQVFQINNKIDCFQ